jgi:hypothetical protein
LSIAYCLLPVAYCQLTSGYIFSPSRIVSNFSPSRTVSEGTVQWLKKLHVDLHIVRTVELSKYRPFQETILEKKF